MKFCIICCIVLHFVLYLGCNCILLSYLLPFFSPPKLQFNLRVGLIGVVYLASTTAYGVCTIIVGPITDRLVGFCDLYSVVKQVPCFYSRVNTRVVVIE